MDRYRQYWLGKKPSVKEATEDFLKSNQPIKDISEKHGVSIGAINNNARMLRFLNRVGQINLAEILGDVKKVDSSA
jgi:hypothetical protein